MRATPHRRPAGAQQRTYRAGTALALAGLLATTPLAAAEYYRADRFGTPLAPLAGDPGPGAGFVLVVDTAAEAEAGGLQARRRLLKGGETVQEWRRTAAAGGSLEQELEEGRMVAERRYDGAGLLLEERRFSAAGELRGRDVLRYRGSALYRVETYDAVGGLLTTDSFDLTSAGRLRRFARIPVPAASGSGAPAMLSLVFRRGEVIEERHGAGDVELIVRSAGGTEYAREEWAGERLLAEHRSPPATAGETATATRVDGLGETRTETTYDAAGRPATVRKYAASDTAGHGGELLEERIFRYHTDGSLASLEVAGASGIETYRYTYDAGGRRVREEYRRRGRVVRVTTYPTPKERVDEVYSADDTVLRVFWRNQVRVREELLRDGVLIRTHDPAPPPVAGAS